MKKIVAAGAVFALLAVTGVLLFARKPAQVPASSVVIEKSPERLARGRYLFETVMDCGGCHSERDFTKFGGPEIEGRKGVGFEFPPEMGLPGRVSSANITSHAETGLGRWTDGEILRAIREGVSRDGRALFPMMPYDLYRDLSDNDAHSLVAYVRTLPPVQKKSLGADLNFPVNLLIRSAPQPLPGPVPVVSRRDPVAYGRYLTTIGGCVDCHTPKKNGKAIEERKFSGGNTFTLFGMTVHSANLTPEMDTGIGAWTEERFVSKFRGYAHFDAKTAPPANQTNFTVMPWLKFSHLEDADLKAIYAFLRTIPAVRNTVDPHKPLTQS